LRGAERAERVPPGRGPRRGAGRRRGGGHGARRVRAREREARDRRPRARRQARHGTRRGAAPRPRAAPGARRRRRARPGPLPPPPGAARPPRGAGARRGGRRVIASLAGTLAEKSTERLVVDVGGVGYAVQVSLQTFSDLPPAGTTVRLLVHTEVREDAIELIGFLRADERTLF